MSIRSKLVSGLLLRPSKFLYRIFRPSPKKLRLIIHPISSIGSLLASPTLRATCEKEDFGVLFGGGLATTGRLHLNFGDNTFTQQFQNLRNPGS